MTKIHHLLFASTLTTLLIAGCKPRHPDEDGGIQQPDSGMPGDGDGDGDGDAGASPDAQVPADSGTPGDGDGDGGIDAGPIEMCGDSDRDVLGTVASPYEVPLASLPFEERVDWRGRAFLRITGLTVGERYAVEMSGAPLLHMLTFESGSGYILATCAATYQGGLAPASCVVTATTSSIDVTIDIDDDDGDFTLDVKVLTEGEGTMPAPVQLGPGDLPYHGSATMQTASLYEITGLTTGQPYVVTVTAGRGTFGIVHMYQQAGWAQRSFTKSGATFARGFGTPVGTSLYLALIANQTATPIEIAIAPNPNVSEGTAAAPVDIALPYEGMVGSSRLNVRPPAIIPAQSYYAITGLAPGGHLVKLTAPEGTMLAAYGEDATFNNSTAQCGAHAGSDGLAECGARISGTTLYVSVLTNEAGTAFTLELDELPFVAEGSEGAPIELASSALPYAGEFESRIHSYYQLTGLTPDEPYLVRIVDASDALAFATLFDGGTEICRVLTALETPACVVTPSGTTLDVTAGAVQPLLRDRAVGSAFTLDVQPYVFDGVGTAEEPFEIACAQATIETHVPATGASFYVVTGVTPGAPYLVEVSGADLAGSVVVAPGESAAPFDELPCTETYGGVSVRCVAASDNDRIYVKISANGPDDVGLTVRAVASGSEGSASAPLELELPYSGVAASAAPSYYVLPGLTKDALYVLRASTEQEQVLLDVYADAARSEQLFSTFIQPGSPAEGLFTSTADTVYIVIRVDPEHDGVTAFELDVALSE